MKFSRAHEIVIEQIAKKHGLTVDEVKEIVATPTKFIQEKSKKIVFEDGLTREEFDKKKKNFNIPAIGKLYASYFLYNEIQKKKNKKKNEGRKETGGDSEE